MALPSIADLKMWVGTLFTKDDWDYNFSQIVSWLADGTGDLVVNSIKSENGIDLDGSQLSNLAPATTGSQAVTLDQANTILNRTSYYYPFSVASGKVDNDGNAAYLQKDSDTQVTVLAGNVNPDLVCVLSDGTIESVTSNTVLTVPVTNGTYHIVKEKEQAISLTSGSANKITISSKFPSTQNTGDYFLDNSVVPFKGYKYGLSGWEETPFCWLGDVSVSSGTATIKQFVYNNNSFDVNIKSLDLLFPDFSTGVSKSPNVDYTESTNGWIVFTGASNVGNATVLYIDGAVASGFGGITDGTGSGTFIAPVPKGATYQVTGSNVPLMKFYKCKGEV